jgi:hypothetical protein
MTVTVRPAAPATYGWSADGKTAAEISSDLRQTRYRLEADVSALRQKVGSAKRLLPIVTLGLAAITFLIRRIRRRHRR